MYQELISLKDDIRDVNNKLSLIEVPRKEIATTQAMKEAFRFGKTSPAAITRVRFSLFANHSSSDEDKSLLLKKLMNKIRKCSQENGFDIEIHPRSTTSVDIGVINEDEVTVKEFIEEIISTCNCSGQILGRTRVL